MSNSLSPEEIEEARNERWRAQAWASRAAAKAVERVDAPGMLAYGSYDSDGNVLAVAVIFVGPNAGGVLESIIGSVEEIQREREDATK